MFNERLHAKDLIKDYKESVFKCIDDMTDTVSRLRKVNESDRTIDYHIQKKILEWFETNGGLRI